MAHDDANERGKRPAIAADGEVHGSGSGAGGGNFGEDYDDDPKAGAGAEPVTPVADRSGAS